MLLELFLILNKEYVIENKLNILMTTHCEQCGLKYHYLMFRHIKTSAVDWFRSGGDRAQQRAIKKAQNKVNRMMAREAELVPCPQCYWISQSLVEGYSRGWRMERSTSVILAAGGFVVCMLAAGALTDLVQFHGLGWNENLVLALSFVLMGLGSLLPVYVHLVQQWLMRRRNYNLHWPEYPKNLPVGTPRALLPTDITPDCATYEEVIVEDPQQLDGSREAVFHLGQFKWPAQCCQCLEPTERMMNIQKGQDKLGLPFCRACAKRRAWRKLAWVSAFTLLAAAVIGISLYNIPATPLNRDLRASVVFWTVAAWLGLVVVYLMTLKKPFKWKWINRDQGRFWVQTRHPTFNQMLQEYALSQPQVVHLDEEE